MAKGTSVSMVSGLLNSQKANVYKKSKRWQHVLTVDQTIRQWHQHAQVHSHLYISPNTSVHTNIFIREKDVRMKLSEWNSL